MTTSAIAEIKREKEKKKGFKAASVNDPTFNQNDGVNVQKL